MTNSEKKPPKLQEWATKKLGAAPDTPWDEVRAVFLQKLTAASFHPPPADDAAFRYLNELQRDAESAAPPPGALFDEETRLRQEVERYADAFFTFSVKNRKQKWILLFSRCAWLPPLAAWLDALKPGLSIDLTSLESVAPRVERLISRLCFLFTLRPVERAHCRRDIVQSLNRDGGDWQSVAQFVSDNHPALAALDRELTQALLSTGNLGDPGSHDTMDAN